MVRTGSATLAAVMATVVLSACGSRTATATPHDGAAGSPSRAARPRAAAGEPAGHRTALIMPMPSAVGQVVTDDYMLTLYRSDNDAASPSASHCTGACATRWPPVLVDGPVTYADGDQSPVGSLTRPDGTRQLTLRGWPLYRFAGDLAEGEANGHRVDGVWFAVAPDGAKVGPSSSSGP